MKKLSSFKDSTVDLKSIKGGGYGGPVYTISGIIPNSPDGSGPYSVFQPDVDHGSYF